MLLGRNGNVLEQILSPLTIHTTPEHEELAEIARTCITRRHLGHYAGMFTQSRSRMAKEGKVTAKTALHMYRTLLTGIALLRTGEVKTHLPTMAREAQLPLALELIARRSENGEEEMAPGEAEECRKQGDTLAASLEEAGQNSTLPAGPRGKGALNDLILRLRTETRDRNPETPR